MGCFLGCFGGDKDQRRRKHRVKRASPQTQRNRVQNAQQERNRVQNLQQENLSPVEQKIEEIPIANLVSEFPNKPEAEEQLSPSPSPRKRVTFNTQVTTYEHVSIHESIDSLPEDINTNIEKEKPEDIKSPTQSHSLSEEDNSVTSSVGSYPSNHRYHNARDSDDEYGDSDLEDLDDEDEDEDEYDDDDYDYDEDIDVKSSVQESVITSSMESRTGNPTPRAINEEVDSPMTKARDRSDYISSVLNPVENITQWKAAKSRLTNPSKPPQKENVTSNLEAPPPRMSFSSEPTFKQTSSKSKSDLENQEIAVDASLSNWLASPQVSNSKKTIIASGSTMSVGSTPPRSFEDRPILGALTVEELRQISVTSSPRKSPSRSPDEMPIIGSVGSYWSHSGSGKQSGSLSSYKGIPNTTSKYREDKRVQWHSTPFETRLDRALNRGAAEA